MRAITTPSHASTLHSWKFRAMTVYLKDCRNLRDTRAPSSRHESISDSSSEDLVRSRHSHR